MVLANLSIYYTWKNIKSEHSSNKFKISTPTWNDNFSLLDDSYSIADIQDYFEFIIKIYHSDDPTLKNSLFGAVRLTENADIDKYQYSGYGIGFDGKSSFSFPSGAFGQNVIIFGVDMSSSAHFDNKKKDILILSKGSTQWLEHTLTAEKMYSISFTVTRKKFWLSLQENGANNYLFVNGREIYKFKAKDSEIVAAPLCLGNISKD